jgi:hypothetical protein
MQVAARVLSCRDCSRSSKSRCVCDAEVCFFVRGTSKPSSAWNVEKLTPFAAIEYHNSIADVLAVLRRPRRSGKSLLTFRSICIKPQASADAFLPC